MTITSENAANLRTASIERDLGKVYQESEMFIEIPQVAPLTEEEKQAKQEKARLDAAIIKTYGKLADPDGDGVIIKSEEVNLLKHIIDPDGDRVISVKEAPQAVRELLEIAKSASPEPLAILNEVDTPKKREAFTKSVVEYFKGGIHIEGDEDPSSYLKISEKAIRAGVKALYDSVPHPDLHKHEVQKNESIPVPITPPTQQRKHIPAVG